MRVRFQYTIVELESVYIQMKCISQAASVAQLIEHLPRMQKIQAPPEAAHKMSCVVLPCKSLGYISRHTLMKGVFAHSSVL